MSNDQLQYSIVGVDDSEAITVFVPGRPAKTVFSNQPNYEEIVRLAKARDESLFDLISPEKMIAQKFEDLSERVSVANGRLYFDRDEVDNSLSQHVLRLLNEGGDFKPWVLFMEKLDENPQKESKEMLYEFLHANEGGFTLTPNGDVVAYKGVQNKDGEFHSLNRGSAYVEEGGQMTLVTGTIPYRIGTVVEMPRSEVAFDPNNPCSTGLHVATWQFAQSFGRSGVILEVHVHPRDIVSVPKDASGEKVRVCRLYVKGVTEKKHDTAVTNSSFEWSETEGEDDWLGTDDEEQGFEGNMSEQPVADEPAEDESPKAIPSDWQPNRGGGFFNWLRGNKS